MEGCVDGSSSRLCVGAYKLSRVTERIAGVGFVMGGVGICHLVHAQRLSVMRGEWGGGGGGCQTGKETGRGSFL